MFGRIVSRRALSTSRALRSAPGATKEELEAATNLWKKMSFFVAIPTVAITTWFCLIPALKHEPHRPEFIPYEYLRIRRTPFPWGDGKHTLFHNPKVNPLPDGYEDE